jgi:transcriptional regulator with XRE-family HTH domain
LTGAEIRFLRKELGCSQKALAEILATMSLVFSPSARFKSTLADCATISAVSS